MIAPRRPGYHKNLAGAASIQSLCCRRSRSAAWLRALTETIERDPLFLRAPRVVIPASINALHFYQELGYAFAPGGDRLDEEQLYCLEKFPQRSV